MLAGPTVSANCISEKSIVLNSSLVTAATGLMFSCGRVYTLTLLYTMFLRERAQRASFSGASGGYFNNGSMAFGIDSAASQTASANYGMRRQSGQSVAPSVRLTDERRWSGSPLKRPDVRHFLDAPTFRADSIPPALATLDGHNAQDHSL